MTWEDKQKLMRRLRKTVHKKHRIQQVDTLIRSLKVYRAHVYAMRL